MNKYNPFLYEIKIVNRSLWETTDIVKTLLTIITIIVNSLFIIASIRIFILDDIMDIIYYKILFLVIIFNVILYKIKLVRIIQPLDSGYIRKHWISFHLSCWEYHTSDEKCSIIRLKHDEYLEDEEDSENKEDSEDYEYVEEWGTFGVWIIRKKQRDSEDDKYIQDWWMLRK